jgi:ribulose-5-phosphate 4-epimerase/fuculose-1-phosphate aldolase
VVPFDWNLEPIEGLTLRGEIALALRILDARGYDDNFFGHITVRQEDGSYLTNPWEIMWDDMCASDLLVMDLEGRKLAGRYSVTPGVNLHLAIRRHVTGPEANIIIHQHPRYATLWATRKEIPPVFDQGSAWAGEDLYLLDEFESGDVISGDHAQGIGRARAALLAAHGVVVLGETLPDTVFRAAMLEYRCRRAWELEGKPGVEPLDREVIAALVESLRPPKFVEKWWAAEIFREARRSPAALR